MLDLPPPPPPPPPPPDDRADPQFPELREVITEFGRHMDMLADQLGTSLLEADRDCVSVGESFHELAAVKAVIDGMTCPEPERAAALRESARQMGESLHAAVVALQYHDRLAQRLALIRTGLARLTALLHDAPARSYQDWIQSLQEVDRINRSERRRLDPDAEHQALSRPPEESHSVELF